MPTSILITIACGAGMLLLTAVVAYIVYKESRSAKKDLERETEYWGGEFKP